MLEAALVVYYVFVACIIAIGVRSKKDWLTECLLLLLPFLGVIFCLLLWYVKRKPVEDGDMSRFEQLAPEFGASTEVHREVEVAKEINVISLEDALVHQDLATRRRVLLDMLKNESFQTPTLLERALQNEDTETSHYAVTAVMEIKRKLLLGLQQLSVQYELDRGNAELLRSYAAMLQKYMDSSLFDKQTQDHNRQLYDKVLKDLLELDRSDEAIFVEKINNSIQMKDYAEARRYCQLFRESFPDRETPYFIMLKLFYTLKLNKEFYEVLNELKSSPIRVSNQVLNTIRFWSRGA